MDSSKSYGISNFFPKRIECDLSFSSTKKGDTIKDVELFVIKIKLFRINYIESM